MALDGNTVPEAVASARRWGAGLLEAAGVGAASASADRLLLHVLERERAFLFAHPEALLTPAQRRRYEELLRERAEGVPVQYLTGEQEFYGRVFQVTPAVLIPRPETEFVVAVALEKLPPGASRRFVDVGTGSGAIAVTLKLERPEAEAWATEISAAALAIAAANAQRLAADIQWRQGDLLAPLLPSMAGSFDLVASNPPYIAAAELPHLQREVRDYEPRVALTPGASGLEAYRRLIPQAEAALRSGGWLILELGYRSADDVQGLLAERWEAIERRADLQGWDRVLAARKP